MTRDPVTTIATALPQFPIQASGPVSLLFFTAGIHNFHDALQYVRTLPYGRTSDQADLPRVIGEGRGTCSNKHALLASLAEEQGFGGPRGIQLMLGVYSMTGANTPGSGPILETAGLDYVPEAHCYLQWEGTRYDFTIATATPAHFENALLEEHIISPLEATTTKKEYHQEFLRQWLKTQPGVSLTFDELWAVREACIEALVQYVRQRNAAAEAAR